MRAFSTVRFRPKTGQEKEFEELFQKLPRDFRGLRSFALVKAKDGLYFSIGEWDSMDDLDASRKAMIANLDRFRHTLKEHGGSLGVTDAISGEVIFPA